VSNAIAELASEYWKLLKSFERAVAVAPDDARARLSAHARYAHNKLETILATVGMRVVAFDGLPFEFNMPAVAINADEYVDVENVVVERTLEPAVISDMAVIITGKVYLARA
jgi:hypothetical protein